MNEEKYSISIDNEVIADSMNIQTAMILIEALFNTYYRDESLKILISRKTDSPIDNNVEDLKRIE